jgi:hypothetical protein
MNPPERLWRALGRRDWEAVRAQFQATAVVDCPHSGERMNVEAYVTAHAARRGKVHVRNVVGEGRRFAVEAEIGSARCAGFYDLHEGLISLATEYWLDDIG